MALLNQFPYGHLKNPSTIRLIQIEEEKVHGLIVCTVKYGEQTRITYTALSYCWGDDTEIRQIYLRRRPGGTLYLFPVHDSLGRFLDWAWNQKICSTRIWTDKICLDQSDEQEKKQQIPRMGDIFRNAKNVLAWLDMTEIEGESLMPILDYDGFFRGLNSGRLDFNILPKETQDATKRLSCLDYWRRVWIVQECAIANEVIFVIGNEQANFDEFERGLRGFRERIFDSILLFPTLIKNMEALTKLREGRGKRKLWRVLEMMSTGKYLSKNTEDRFYGAMALVARYKNGKSPLDNIVVNKKKKPSETLLDAVLEAKPPLKKCSRWFRTMLFAEGGMIQESSIFEALQHYLESKRTQKRHKSLVHHALQACDAMNIISSLPGCHCTHRVIAHSMKRTYVACGMGFSLPRSLEKVLDQRRHFGLYKLISRVKSTESGDTWSGTTVQDNAILMGLIVAERFRIERSYEEAGLGVKEPSVLRSWKAWRMSHAPAHSPWLCATHQLPGQSDERLRAESSTRLRDWFDMETLVTACERYSQDCCDGSQMTFENREVGFRYTIRPHEKRSSFRCRHTSTVRIEWLHTEQTLDPKSEDNQQDYEVDLDDFNDYLFASPWENASDEDSLSDDSDHDYKRHRGNGHYERACV